MKNIKKTLILLLIVIGFTCSCNNKTMKNEHSKINKVNKEVGQNKIVFPNSIKIESIAQNPEGIEFDKNDNTFLLSSQNADPIIKINLDGTFKQFTKGEKFPLSTAGLHIDYDRNRLLVAAFDSNELFDENPATKGVSYLRIYNLETGNLEQDINLSFLVPNAKSYFANDITVDNNGNVYISDWYAKVVYKVDLNGTPSVFWKNKTSIPSGPNGIDFHPDGFLLVSILDISSSFLYIDYGLVKIPLNDPQAAQLVNITDTNYHGFDGMVINANGNVIGITNNGKTGGGNVLMELKGIGDWSSANVINLKAIKESTTVAVTPENKYYVINQDFSDDSATTWIIKQIKF